jgi:asparagine synthase (glutamine-hydrolysing)
MTLIHGVRMLEPGHELRASSRGDVRVRRYWSLLDARDRGDAAPDAATVESAAAEVGARLEAAVRSHLVSDVPVGVFLSGGIDSGALVSVLRALDVRPQTFTVGLEGQAADESDDARLVARHFGTDHVEVPLREDDILDMLPSVLSGTDHPSGDGVNTFVVSAAVRARGVKVALSGLGGDELFGGYASFERLTRTLPAARQITRSPAVFRKAAANALRAAGRGAVSANKAAAVLEGDGTLESMWPVTRQVFAADARRRLLSDSVLDGGEFADGYRTLLAEAYRSAGRMPLWSRISFAEARTYMHDVLLRDTDQMSMAHALEVRVPLLDHHLASYVMSLPDAAKREAGSPKTLLVRSLTRPLPPEIVRRPKRGFALPFDTWMRGALRPVCEGNLGPNGLDGRGLLKPGSAQALWRQFLNRAPGVTWSRVWILVALNAWLDRNHVTLSQN